MKTQEHLKLSSGVSRLILPGFTLNSFEIRALPLNELFCPVRDVPIFVEEIRESIKAEGLRNPVIIIRAPREDFVKEYIELGMHDLVDRLPATPVINHVMGGTNRVTAAKELGYTHVDCVLIPDFHLAKELQAVQRGSYT